MLDIFSSIKSIIKIHNISIDNEVFWLHYKLTVILFACSSILITSKQFFGDPIDCIVDEIDDKVIDSYCWIQSTYTMPKMVMGRIGLDIAHPGISGTPVGGWKAEDIKYHKYYQWVCFVLSFEGNLHLKLKHSTRFTFYVQASNCLQLPSEFSVRNLCKQQLKSREAFESSVCL